jgi:hypothetical protein
MLSRAAATVRGGQMEPAQLSLITVKDILPHFFVKSRRWAPNVVVMRRLCVGNDGISLLSDCPVRDASACAGSADALMILSDRDETFLRSRYPPKKPEAARLRRLRLDF